MSAYQPTPTLAQRRALVADHARRYRDADHAITEYRVAQLRYEMERMARQPEPCQFCAEPDDAPGLSLPAVIGCCIAGLGTWAAIGYATWWLVGFFFGANA